VRAVADYHERRVSNRPGVAIESWDLDRGWATLTHEARDLLEIYRRRGEQPPSEPPEDVKAMIIRFQAAGREDWGRLLLRLRKILAVHQLGRGMAIIETQDRIILTGVGAGRGQCHICGRLLEHGRAWRDLGHDRSWCAEHGRIAGSEEMDK
jgi:hypothetical protein